MNATATAASEIGQGSSWRLSAALRAAHDPSSDGVGDPAARSRNARSRAKPRTRLTRRASASRCGWSRRVNYDCGRGGRGGVSRFTQPDTIILNPANPQDLNRYSYVRNNPVRYNDPSGHDCNDTAALGVMTLCSEIDTSAWGEIDSEVIKTEARDGMTGALGMATSRMVNVVGSQITWGGTLDFLGVIPGVGDVVDGARAIGNLVQGDFTDAAIYAAGIAPIPGMSGTTTKASIDSAVNALRQIATSVIAAIEATELPVTLASEVHPDAVRQGGLAALMSAAYLGAVGLAEDLVRRGADLAAGDDEGFTALMYAANEGQREMVTLLIDAGADVNQADAEGSTALMFAAQHGQLAIVKRLLAAGADPKIRRRVDDLTARDFAAGHGHERVAAVLLAVEHQVS